MFKKLIISTASVLFLAMPVLAAGTSETTFLSNPLALIMVILMALMLLIIGLLANVLTGTADFKRTEEKAKESKSAPAALTLLLLLAAPSLFAQEGGDATTTTAAATTIGGMSKTLFYTMSSVLFLELFVIIALLINIKFLIKAEREKLAEAQERRKQRMLNWWDRFNKFKSIDQEADIDLGHNYDGIRELDNRLPPWWLYGFYISIIFAGIYLWRYHVTHTAPSSKEEYETAVAQAEIKIKEYLKAKGESVDENTVTLLTATEDIAAGKSMFVTSCASCHKADGAGDVGPNLTDDYWMHGADVKSVFKTIRYGINAMPQWQNTYSNKQIAQITAFIKSIHGSKPAGAKAPQGELVKEETNATAAVAIDSAAVKK